MCGCCLGQNRHIKGSLTAYRWYAILTLIALAINGSAELFYAFQLVETRTLCGSSTETESASHQCHHIDAVVLIVLRCGFRVTAIVVTTQRMFGLCGHDKAFNPLTTHDRLLEYARANSKSASPSREVLPTHVSTHTNPVNPEEGRPRRKRSLSPSSRISR